MKPRERDVTLVSLYRLDSLDGESPLFGSVFLAKEGAGVVAILAIVPALSFLGARMCGL
jgi:hypothetical protein